MKEFFKKIFSSFFTSRTPSEEKFISTLHQVEIPLGAGIYFWAWNVPAVTAYILTCNLPVKKLVDRVSSLGDICPNINFGGCDGCGHTPCPLVSDAAQGITQLPEKILPEFYENIGRKMDETIRNITHILYFPEFYRTLMRSIDSDKPFANVIAQINSSYYSYERN